MASRMPMLRRRLRVLLNLSMRWGIQSCAKACPASSWPLAAWLDRCRTLQFGGQIVGLVGRETEFGEAVVRHVESGLASAAVDDDTDGYRVRTVFAALFQRLDHAPAAGDDVLDDKHLFAGFEFEIAAQFELVVYFLKENEAQAQLSGNFLADD